jgi:peptidoglycan-associated lipoprotein
MRRSIFLAVALVMMVPAMFFMTSCAKKAVQTEQVSTTQPEVQNASDSSAEKVQQAEDLREDRLRAEAATRGTTGPEFVNENILFDFDSSALLNKAQRILENNTEYLHAHLDVTITIEGHCDDRGTDTYNLALGQRRAESVKKFLVDRGISSNRLDTVSYGERHPIALDRNEAAWAKNRRAEIVVNLFSDVPKSAKN